MVAMSRRVDSRTIFPGILFTGGVLLGVVACTGGSSSSGGLAATPEVDAGGDAGGDRDRGDVTPTPAAALGCADILTCASECPEADEDACSDGCLERGSKPAQDAVLTLVSCVQDKACEESTCIQEKCGTELGACLEQAASGVGAGESPPTAAEPSELPAALLGVWDKSAIRYEFEANGVTTLIAIFTTSYSGCQSKTEVYSTGVSTVNGDQLVYHRAEGTVTSVLCSGPPKVSPLAAADFTYTYELGTTDDGKATLTLTSPETGATTYVKH